jgi:hypothetical protein
MIYWKKKNILPLAATTTKKNQSQSYITTIFLKQFKEDYFFKTTPTIPLKTILLT